MCVRGGEDGFMPFPSLYVRTTNSNSNLALGFLIPGHYPFYHHATILVTEQLIWKTTCCKETRALQLWQRWHALDKIARRSPAEFELGSTISYPGPLSILPWYIHISSRILCLSSCLRRIIYCL